MSLATIELKYPAVRAPQQPNGACCTLKSKTTFMRSIY